MAYLPVAAPQSALRCYWRTEHMVFCQVIATEQMHFGKLSPSRERNTIVTIGFGQVVIDSQRAEEIAAFWSALLDRPINDGANQFFALIPASDDRAFPALMFLAVPEPRQGKNRMHLDLVATDLPAEVERAVALGATKIAEFDEYGTRWTTLTDPEGNVFDIGVRHSPGEPAG